MTDLRYPIGPPSYPETTTAAQRAEWIREIAACPAGLRAAIEGLNNDQLATPYRPEGWTVRQVVHHVVDSHINSWVRFKWTLTENHPTIKAYDEVAWAKLPDYTATPLEVSLGLLEMLHLRWVVLLESLTEADWQRGFHHPESHKDLRLEQILANYAWHGKHHTAHITALRARMGW
jgi:hypothetical protein